MTAREYNRLKMRRRAARLKTRGLTTRGTERKYTLRPQLHGLCDEREYDRRWHNLKNAEKRRQRLAAALQASGNSMIARLK